MRENGSVGANDSVPLYPMMALQSQWPKERLSLEQRRALRILACKPCQHVTWELMGEHKHFIGDTARTVCSLFVLIVNPAIPTST